MKKISFNLDNKNIIITGGNGFLGSQITDALLKERAKSRREFLWGALWHPGISSAHARTRRRGPRGYDRVLGWFDGRHGNLWGQ